MSAAQSEARQKMLYEPGRLYAAYSRYCDWVKIGFTSKSVAERIEGIDRQYAEFAPFSLIGSVPSLWAAERQIHGWFAPFRNRQTAATAELYPASRSVVGAINAILASDRWDGLTYPETTKMREWARQAAKHPLNHVEAVICFDRYRAERALRLAEGAPS